MSSDLNSGLGLWCLMPIQQYFSYNYDGGQFYLWRKQEYSEKTTDKSMKNPNHGGVYSIQHYVIKFVSDLRQVSGFLWAFRFPPQIKLTAMI